MKFHEYISMYMYSKSIGMWSEDFTSFYRGSVEIAREHGSNIGKNHFLSEFWWHEVDRPYYCVWPAIIPTFCKLPLDVDSGLILPPQKPFSIRLPVENNPLQFEDRGVRYTVKAMLTNYCEVQGIPGITTWIDYGETEPDSNFPVYSFRNIQCIDGKTVDDIIKELPIHPSAKMGVNVPDELIADCVRIVCCLCMLGDDPLLIMPDVIASDLAKWELTKDYKYVAKAHRRHKVGWHIGRDIEVSPHFRRSHWAWYWTGPGGKIPQLILRRGEGPGGSIVVKGRMMDHLKERKNGTSAL